MEKISIKTNEKAKQWIFIGGIFLFLLFLHAFIQPDFGDDLTYAGEYGEWKLIDFLRTRYAEWSSRVVIEMIMKPLIGMPVWMWRILNTLIVVLLIYNVGDLFGLYEKKGKLQAQCIFFVLIWSVPLASLKSAGWITTTTNYLWVLSLGTVALRPLKHFAKGEKCKLWEYIFCPLCALYAANMEQAGAILLGVYLVFGLYFLVKKRKVSPFYFLMLLLVILSVYVILQSPGNINRSNQEMENYFPAFAYLAPYEKLLMGFIESTHYYVAAGHGKVVYLFAILTGVLLWETVRKWQLKLKYFIQLLIAFFPFAFYWWFGHIGDYLLYHNYLKRGLNLFVIFGENRNLPGMGKCDARMVTLQVIGYLIVLAFVALTIFFLHGKSEETLLQLLILGAGFSSRLVIGFSPTIYVSGDRTALFASAAILIVVMRNIQLYLRTNPKLVWKLSLLVYLSINIASSLMVG